MNSEDLKARVYALAKLCISALSNKIEEPRKTINDIKFVLEITDEIILNLPEYLTKAMENKVEEVKQQAEKEQKQLQEKIDKLQQEKETFIANQKRVMFTKKIFDVKQYLPCTKENLRKLVESAFVKAQASHIGYWFDTEYVRTLYKDIQNYIEKHASFDNKVNSITPINKEEEYEFINLDEAIKLALNQEDSNYMIELKELKLKNSRLNERIISYDIDKEKEINNLLEQEHEKYNEFKKMSSEKYEELKKKSEEKYKTLEEESSKKYNTLQEEFAKYKEDEENMNMKDKLEKYKKENDDLKAKLSALENKANKTGFFGFLFK